VLVPDLDARLAALDRVHGAGHAPQVDVIGRVTGIGQEFPSQGLVTGVLGSTKWRVLRVARDVLRASQMLAS